jgi:hypothetical protein
MTVRLPLELWRDSRQLADERGQTLSELVRDSLDRERSLEAYDFTRAMRDHGREQRNVEAWRARRLISPGRRVLLDWELETDGHDLEANAPPPTVVAAARSAEIRRRQKARKRSR